MKKLLMCCVVLVGGGLCAMNTGDSLQKEPFKYLLTTAAALLLKKSQDNQDNSVSAKGSCSNCGQQERERGQGDCLGQLDVRSWASTEEIW